MRRRTDDLTTSKKLFNEILYGPLHWPWKTVHLEHDSLIDYRQRPLSAEISLSELYHENSKLFPEMLPQLTSIRLRADEVRQEFLQRRAASFDSRSAVELSLESPWRELLTMLRRAIQIELFYAVEIRVVRDAVLAVYEPLMDGCYIVKHLSAEDRDRLNRALSLFAPGEVPMLERPTWFLLASFARNEILFGRRGYRRTLLEAGQVADAIQQQAKGLGLALRPVCEFTDRDLDAVMEADGIEEGTIMAFQSGEASYGI